MYRTFLEWKELPAEADMSIDTQLKVASCYQHIYLCTVMLLCMHTVMFPIDWRGQALKNKLLLTPSSVVE